MPPNTHGGKRTGSGRKPTGKARKIAVQVRLTADQWVWFDAYCAAQASKTSMAGVLYDQLRRLGMPEEGAGVLLRPWHRKKG
jgi:hypothetical protein